MKNCQMPSLAELYIMAVKNLLCVPTTKEYQSKRNNDEFILRNHLINQILNVTKLLCTQTDNQ